MMSGLNCCKMGRVIRPTLQLYIASSILFCTFFFTGDDDLNEQLNTPQGVR